MMRIIKLKDLPSDGGSKQYRMSSHINGHVDFAILDGELCAHTWNCPTEGREFLKELEEHAKKNNLKLTIPTVLSSKLQYILECNGYIMKEVPYMGDICELWSKD